MSNTSNITRRGKLLMNWAKLLKLYLGFFFTLIIFIFSIIGTARKSDICWYSVCGELINFGLPTYSVPTDVASICASNTAQLIYTLLYKSWNISYWNWPMTQTVTISLDNKDDTKMSVNSLYCTVTTDF